jgi:selenophosphate synthase
MKQNNMLMAAMAITLFTACNFSKGVKKDLTTGLSTSYNGFAVEDVYLTVDGNKLSSNKVTLGKEINIVANGIENYEEKGDKVFPGCSILLTDKAGKEILNIADAFADMSAGVDKGKASLLTATLNTGNPMQVGETYHLKTRFFDKQNKESEVLSDVDIVMTN